MFSPVSFEIIAAVCKALVYGDETINCADFSLSSIAVVSTWQQLLHDLFLFEIMVQKNAQTPKSLFLTFHYNQLLHVEQDKK